MNWYFDSEDNRARLSEELNAWRGAIFRPHECKKGVATDCVQFVHAVLVDMGAITRIEWPRYVTVRGGVSMWQLLIEHLDKVPELIHQPKEAEPMDGDVVAVSAGENGHHVGIVCDYPVIWHCLHGQGVCQGNINDAIGRNLTIEVYRARA
jgi:hypothetical protein